jgi:hypothetical protein
MSSILILLALSALSGFVLASYFSWPAILVAGLVLATLSATVLHNQGFGALSGICVIVACLATNQVAYVIGGIHAKEGPNSGPDDGLPHQQADDEPRESRDDNIRNEHNRHQNTQSDLMHPAELWHTNSTCRFHGTGYIGVAVPGMWHLVALFDPVRGLITWIAPCRPVSGSQHTQHQHSSRGAPGLSSRSNI